MPIDLTTVPEGSEFRRSRRSRRGRARLRHRNHILLALGAGMGLFALVGGVLYMAQYDTTPRSVSSSSPPAPGTNIPADPKSLDKANAPPTVESAEATSSGELPLDKAQAHLHKLRRVKGADNSDDLHLEYEFFKSAQSPDKYLITVSSPVKMGHIAFNKDAARRDVVAMSTVLNQFGSGGPILVWIETIFPARERVSNIMTLP